MSDGTPAKMVRVDTQAGEAAEGAVDEAIPVGRKGTGISVGGGGVRAPSKHLAGHKETPYDYVRMLYRGMDQGVTATSESHEERVARSKQCKTTGWQSRFAVPYRALGTPDLYLPAHKGKSGGGDGGMEERAAGGAGGHGGLSARVMRQRDLGVTPAGRPLNWLPEARRMMTNFGEACRKNRRTHRSVMLKQLSASEARVKCVRAGQMATTVLSHDQLDSARSSAGGAAGASGAGAGGDEGGATFLTSVPSGDSVEPTALQIPAAGRRRPNHVPPLRLGTGSTAADGARSATQSARLPSSGVGGATARSGAATERTRPPIDVVAGGGTSVHQLQARADAISGNVSLVHPVPPLKLVAEQFQHDVDSLTEHVTSELGVKTSERLDTFRRKFKNFEIGELGSSAERRLQAMRVSADQEKLQNAIYLYQNRKWYFQLMDKVKGADCVHQKELLRGIKEMVEGGVVFDKNTVRDLIALCTERSKVANFATTPIQDVFDFLCLRFGVTGDQFDQWVEENGLPLPLSTQQRYEAARQKRVALFKKDVVARHWRQRFDMLAITKDLSQWLPEDVVEAVLEAQGLHAPYSESARSRASSSLSLRSAKSPVTPTDHGLPAGVSGAGEGQGVVVAGDLGGGIAPAQAGGAGDVANEAAQAQ